MIHDATIFPLPGWASKGHATIALWLRILCSSLATPF
jgi:hypothetical protein